MKWMIAVLCIFISSVLLAAPLTEDQRKVNDLITKLYSYSGEEFEVGRFDGKFIPTKLCDFYAKFFAPKLITKPTNYPGCEVQLNRYPSLGSEDLMGPYALSPLPKPQITIPIVNGDKAQIEAIVKRSKFVNVGSRSVYFLTKTQDGWRIEDFLAYPKWPRSDKDYACHPANYLATLKPEVRNFFIKECRE